MTVQQILWDWNGTLLDDLEYAIGVRNRVFPLFGLPPIQSVEEYHSQFTFPVRSYYERAGVNDQNFDEVAHAWMGEYVRGCGEIPLHTDALEAMGRFRAAGLKQVILSASHREILLGQLAIYGLENAFDEVLGLNDIYAGSKEAIGLQYLNGCGIPAQATVMLGDTLHDAEVAQAIKTRCVLVARGHQGRKRLETSGAPVLSTLTEAAELILKWTKPPANE